jgi:hypothetical protein
MPADRRSAGDEIPPGREVIEVRVVELRQLFNAIDPSPFRERDLDPRAEEFIVDWSRDLPAGAKLALRVHLERPPGRDDEAVLLRDAVHGYFRRQAAGSRRNLRSLFQRGRTSLMIALAVLASSIGISDALGAYAGASRVAAILSEGLIIGGWVAMWRPLEVFLYDWWPIRAEARLFDRLAAMPVRLEYAGTERADAWRSDWPERPA